MAYSLPVHQEANQKKPDLGKVTRIPTIDFSSEDLKPGSSSWLSTCRQVRQALEEHTFFVASFEKVSSELQNEIIRDAMDLFSLPKETKLKNSSEKPGVGYISLPHIPYYETFGIGNPEDPREIRKFAQVLGASEKDKFCENLSSFMKPVAELSRLILQMIFQSYGVGKYFESFDSENRSTLRLIKYGKAGGDDSKVWLVGHTDKNLLTVLLQHQVGGLQIKAKNGEFIDLQPSPSHFVVLAGDILQIWSNDRIKATFHQVKLSHDVERYSVGLFTINAGVITVKEEMVDEEHPLLYKPCDSIAYGLFAISEAAKNFSDCIKAFCGLEDATYV